MTLGRHQYLGKREGKLSRFVSKLTTPKERAQMRKMKGIFKKIENDHATRKSSLDSEHLPATR